MPKRQQVPPIHSWPQLERRCTDPTQRNYELIRPVVLHGQSPSARAQETSTAERTFYRHIERFTALGMRGLDPDRPRDPPHTLPLHVRQLIVDLKAEHPPLRVHELATICYVRTGRRPDAKTVKRVLTETPLPFHPTHRFLPYHQIAEPGERRKAVIQLHADGWTTTSIAEYCISPTVVRRIWAYPSVRKTGLLKP